MSKNIILLLIGFTLITSCETWRSECGGKIIVENSIPDTTLYLNGEPYRRDLFELPVVFRPTGKKDMAIKDVIANINIVQIDLKENTGTGDFDIVEISAKTEGDTSVNILVTD